MLTPQQREIVIERMLALDADELDTEQLKWVVLMVLSSQPGQEHAVERLGGSDHGRALQCPALSQQAAPVAAELRGLPADFRFRNVRFSR